MEPTQTPTNARPSNPADHAKRLLEAYLQRPAEARNWCHGTRERRLFLLACHAYQHVEGISHADADAISRELMRALEAGADVTPGQQLELNL
ncbi:MAG: hypothetical protein AB7O57_08380 [Hyphomicrobiaceae bacterium]